MEDYKYSEAFEAEAVRQMVELGHPIHQVAERLKVPYKLLVQWLENSGLNPSAEQTDEVNAIYQENLQLKRQLQELKKKMP